MKFYEVLKKLDEGEITKARRMSWERDDYIYIQNGSVIKPDDARNDVLKNEDKDIVILPHIDKILNNGIAIIGWSPTSEDMLSSDWEI